MKTLTTRVSALMICLLMGGLLTAAAQRPFGPPQGGPGAGGPPPFVEHLWRMLDLTDAQKEQIKTIREAAATAAQPKHEALKPLQEQTRMLIEAPAFDEAAFRSLATQMSAIQVELQVIHARAENGTYNVLTAEQKAKLAELRKTMGERGGGRPGGPGVGRPGVGQ
jgi:protein CpxP